MSSTKGRKRNASKSDMVKSSPKRLKLENIASIEGSLEHERKFSTKCNIMSFSDALTSLLERVISSEDLDSGIKDALKKEENVLQLMELIPAERLYKESSIVGALIFINWTDFGENTMNRFLEYLLGIMKCCNWRSSDFERSPYQKMLFSICRNIYKPSSSLLMTSPEYQILRSKVAGRCKKILKEIFTETKGGDRILQSLSRMWSLPLFAIASIDGVEDYVKFSLSLYYVATEEQQKTIFGMYIQKLSEFEVAATPSTLTAEKITEFEQTRLELIDVLYKTLFKFLDKMCSCKRTKLVSSVSQPEELEKVFNTMLEPLCVAIPPRLEDTQFVQYIPMYFISLDAKYKEKLIGELQRRCSERVSKDKSNESCGYLFSVLGAYTEIKISMFVRHLRKVVKWLKNYSDQFPLKSMKGPTFSAHLNFYNVAQGFFQSIAIRQESFAGNLKFLK